MITKVEINNHIRDLILERKNRALIANSESSRKDFQFLYKFCSDSLDKDAKQIDDIIGKFSQKEIIILNDMFQGILNLCRDEWIGDINPVEKIDNPEHRKHCSLCNQPNNKWVYNIVNKISGKKMNVGSTCIDQFPNITLKVGKTKSQLIKEAKKKVRLQKIILKIPGLERTILEWKNILDNFDILIPLELETPYIKMGEELTELFEDYLVEKKDISIIEEIEDILRQREIMVQQMEKYTDTNIDKKYVATREIVNWLKRKKQFDVIDKLKETGFVTEETASHIQEKHFIEKFTLDINSFSEAQSLNIKIIKTDDENNFIIEPLIKFDFKMICSIEKFLEYFSGIVFRGESKIQFNLLNIFKACDVTDKQSIRLIISELKYLTRSRKYSISVYTYSDDDYYNSSEVDIVDIETGKVHVFPLKRFIEEYKIYAFEVKKITSSKFMEDLDHFIANINHKTSPSVRKLRESRSAGREFNRRER